MEKLVFFLALASLSVAQQQFVKDAKEAAILSEKRYLTGNGQFGSAWTSENGVQFTEEADQDGNRRGAYSYIDPNGVRRTITYTAGKNGFQATGDDIPVAPAAPAASAPQSAQPSWSAAQSASAQPSWSAAQPASAQEWSAPAAPVAPAAARQLTASDPVEEGQYHPIYDDVEYWQRQKSSGRAAAPATPAFSAAPAVPAQQWSAPAANSAPAPAPAPQWRQSVDPAPVQEWEAPAAPAPRQWSAAAPAAAAPPTQLWSAAAAQQSAPVAPVPQWRQAAAQPQSWEFNTVASTEAPHRFFPPGKLDLSRSPDGFAYSFTKS